MPARRIPHATLLWLASAPARPTAAGPNESAAPARASSKPEEVVITGRQLNVENVGDDRVYATHGYNVYPQPGVNARGTLRVSF